jgi:hypothetical protein
MLIELGAAFSNRHRKADAQASEPLRLLSVAIDYCSALAQTTVG